MSKVRLGWEHKKGEMNPTKRYHELVQIYGKPKILVRGKGGLAIWTKEQMVALEKCYERIIIKDEYIPHGSPKKHYDFLYTVVKYHIPKSKLRSIIGLSDSVMYDQLKKELIVRCHFEGANKATILLVLKIARGELTLSEIKRKKLYGKTIMSTVKGTDVYHPRAEELLEQELCKRLS